MLKIKNYLFEHGLIWVWNPDLVGCIMIDLICHCLSMYSKLGQVLHIRLN